MESRCILTKVSVPANFDSKCSLSPSPMTGSTVKIAIEEGGTKTAISQFKAVRKKRLIAKITVTDLAFTSADILSDFYNAIILLIAGETRWGLIALAINWLPGILMIFWNIQRCFCFKQITVKELVWISLVSGLLFPFWVLWSYIKAIWYRNDTSAFQEQYVYCVFFKGLEGFAEAAPQLLFNIYILLVRWKWSWVQIVSMVFSVISLTKTAAENHFIELRLKIPAIKQVVIALPFFMIHIIYRVTVLATLGAYIHFYFIPVFLLLVLINIVISRKILCTALACTFWTAVASPFSCSCFNHMDDGIFEGPGRLELPQTTRFYLFNTLSTFLITSISLSATVLALNKGYLIVDNPSRLPILSCTSPPPFNQTSELGEETVELTRICGDLEKPHHILTVFALPGLIALGLLSLISVFAVWLIARKNSRWMNALEKSRATGLVHTVQALVSDRPGWLVGGPAWRDEWCPQNKPVEGGDENSNVEHCQTLEKELPGKSQEECSPKLEEGRSKKSRSQKLEEECSQKSKDVFPQNSEEGFFQKSKVEGSQKSEEGCSETFEE